MSPSTETTEYLENDDETLDESDETKELAYAEANGVFAWLKPFNRLAREAFSATVEATITKAPEYDHHKQFLYYQSSSEDEESADSEIVNNEEELSNSAGNLKEIKWSGAFKFSLNTLPRNPAQGWRLGSSKESDILLIPPLAKPENYGLYSNHARLYLDERLPRLVLEARHTVLLSMPETAKITKLQSRLLESGEQIAIGNCVYGFRMTVYNESVEFKRRLDKFKEDHYGFALETYKLLSPAAMANPIRFRNYSFTPSAIAEGTFGRVASAWDNKGKLYAIKHFKQSRPSKLRRHQEMMSLIGQHVSSANLSLKCCQERHVSEYVIRVLSPSFLFPSLVDSYKGNACTCGCCVSPYSLYPQNFLSLIDQSFQLVICHSVLNYG